MQEHVLFLAWHGHLLHTYKSFYMIFSLRDHCHPFSSFQHCGPFKVQQNLSAYPTQVFLSTDCFVVHCLNYEIRCNNTGIFGIQCFWHIFCTCCVFLRLLCFSCVFFFFSFSQSSKFQYHIIVALICFERSSFFKSNSVLVFFSASFFWPPAFIQCSCEINNWHDLLYIRICCKLSFTNKQE